jgi:elongation factor Ts
MANYSTEDIKKLREETGAGMMDCKKALDEADGNFAKAKEIVRERGLMKADKKADRETKEGCIGQYLHFTNKVGAMVEVLCETDFVVRNEEFQQMARNLAMQVASTNPANVEAFLEEEYLREPSKTVAEYVKELSGKIGEKFVVSRLVRYEVGEESAE